MGKLLIRIGIYFITNSIYVSENEIYFLVGCYGGDEDVDIIEIILINIKNRFGVKIAIKKSLNGVIPWCEEEF